MSGAGEQPVNALLTAANAVPLEQEIRRLIAVHGAEAVKAEVKAATRPRRGRKQEKDWPLLYPFLEQDARDWLEGRDPFALRSQKSIAREVATQNPGHSFDSTMRRLERKLASSRSRFMLYAALEISRRDYPFASYLRTVEELAKASDTWRRTRELEGQILARYVEVYGEPDPAMTWQDLEAKPRYPNALEALLPRPKPSGGMFGNLSRAKG